MDIGLMAALFVAAAVVSFAVGVPLQRWLVRHGRVDIPNARSSHREPVVRGGGIAIIAGILIGGVLGRAAGVLSGAAVIVLVTAAILAIVSWIDDVRSLPPHVRFAAHAAAAGVAGGVLWPEPFGVVLGAGLGWILPPIVAAAVWFLWMTGYTNAFNFMDGINGIAAIQAMVTGIGSAVVLWLGGARDSSPLVLALVVAGAAAGFLPHNFPRARMFMGDVSSAPLGFLLAVVLLWGAKEAGPWIVIPLALLHTNFVLDTAITLIRRIVRRERWYESHREHFYQRLNRSGWSHARIALAEAGLQIVVAALSILYCFATVSFRAGIVLAVAVLWLAFFLFCEIRFRRSGALAAIG